MKPVKVLLLCLFASICLTCSDLINPINYPEQNDLLDSAYANQSDVLLHEFFLRWSNESQPLKASDFENLSTEKKAVYEIYELFYDPRKLDRIGGSEWGNELYQGYPFFIVQNKIYFRIVDIPGSVNTMSFPTYEEYLKFIASRDSIKSFQPRLNFNPIMNVYLSEKYEKIINNFLGSQNTINSSMTTEEKLKRRQFLSKMSNIIHGHWGNYYHINTHPEVYLLEIDKHLENAYITFRIAYEGGYARFKKIPQGWTMTEAKLTWIE